MNSGKGGQGDLWDDTVFIKAFNDAIFKYKPSNSNHSTSQKMHNMEQNTDSANSEKASSCKEDVSDLVNNAHDAERSEEINDDGAIASNTKSEIDDIGEKSTVKEASCLESEVPKNNLNLSNEQYFQCEPTVHPNSQGPEDYNQLLNKYYELEAQRQKILQELNQSGYGNNYFDYGTATSEQHHTSATQAHWGITGSFCPYGCQSWIAPCTSEPSCCFSQACPRKSCYAPAENACSKDSVPHEDNDIVKTEKTAAERVLSSLEQQVHINEGEERKSETQAADLAKNASSETDLTVVLNAWYSAGFYTGKYLSEQSLAKK